MSGDYWFEEEKDARIHSLRGIRALTRIKDQDDQKVSAKDTLACSPTFGGNIEITITYPHNVGFLRMNSERQKKLLFEIFRITCAAVPVVYHLDRQCYAEYDKTGQRHIHGYLKIDPNYRAFPIGIISDMAKACLAEYPKKYNKFVPANVYNEYCSYRCPQCKIKYRYNDDIEDNDRFQSWISYCQKLQ